MNGEVNQLVDECFEMITGAKIRYCTGECCKKNNCGKRVLKNKNCALMSFFIGYLRKVDQGYSSITLSDIAIAIYPFVRLDDGVKFKDLLQYCQSGGWEKIRKVYRFSAHGGSIKKRVEKKNGGADLAYSLIAAHLLRERINKLS